MLIIRADNHLKTQSSGDPNLKSEINHLRKMKQNIWDISDVFYLFPCHHCMASPGFDDDGEGFQIWKVAVKL
jgi:hypothetical protein